MESSTIEYTARTVSPLVNGEARLVITDKALSLITPLDAMDIPFSEINSLDLTDYVVTVKADSGDFVFSKMGNWCQPFYDSLCGAYNKAVVRSLFVKGDPVVTAKGEYKYNEAFVSASGFAPVYVYENCVVVLPTDLGARRVPLCFTRGIDKGEFELTLTLDTGETYSWAKLGYDTAPFAEAVENQMRVLRGKSLAAVKEIDPTLESVQASQLAKLIPQGASASFGQLSGIASSFAEAMEEKIADTRAAEGYKAFKELCDPAKIFVGFRKNEEAEDGDTENTSENIEALEDTDGEEAAQEQDAYLLWLIAPSPDGQFAAVEFAEANTATFVYRTGGDFERFAWQLSRALEAIDFKREVIRLSDKDLRKPENADYYMASKRTAALKFIRENFVARVIHSSPETWKKKLLEHWGVV